MKKKDFKNGKINLSVVIPTLNEERNIEECIKSIGDFAKEIIVVDMGSVDKTCEVAKRKDSLVKGKVKVILNKIEKDKVQGIQRNVNLGIKEASGDWIMRVDADERLTREFKKELIEKIKEGKFDAFYINRKQWFINGFLTGGDWVKSKIIRVFKKGAAFYDLSLHVHEKFLVKGKKGEIKEPLLHYSHISLYEVLKRFNEYTDSEAKDKKKRRFLFLDMLIRPIYVLARTMTIKGEWKDGTRGVVAGLLWAFYQFLAYGKAWELKRKMKDKKKN